MISTYRFMINYFNSALGPYSQKLELGMKRVL